MRDVRLRGDALFLVAEAGFAALAAFFVTFSTVLAARFAVAFATAGVLAAAFSALAAAVSALTTAFPTARPVVRAAFPVAVFAGASVRSATVAVAAALRSDSIAFSADTFRLYDSPVANVRP